MNNFDFYNPTHIVFGKDRLQELDKLIPSDAKVLLLFGGGSVKKYGTYDKVIKALGEREVVDFGGIEPNPQYDTLMKAVEVVKTQDITFLLAVGGGSVMDGTKFISLAANFDGTPSDLLVGKAKTSEVKVATPLGTVCTLPATGSEMNAGGVISFEGGKYGMGSPLVYPKFSFLDPTLTYSLPKVQVANGVVDAFVHTLEQYSTFPADAKFQDRTAEGILQSLIEIGKTTLDNPTDYDARANLVWCATNALNGLIGAGVPNDWATHMLGHELTAMFGIDHAQTLAIVQPALWTVRKEKKKAKLLQYSQRVWGITEGSDDEIVDAGIAKTREFFESLGLKTRMSEYGITEDKIDDLVKALGNHGMTALSETRDLDLDVSRAIFQEAM
ncbi:MAG: iron-containing alcohol dehydrogenase [Candidatus Cloacimonetes bacterium]|nr:iron-containing alcohol dehydrogenase [Candidatus Cloacimonadota bacterium]